MKKLLISLVFVILPLLTFAQSTGTVSGRIVDEDGVPLIAANIIVLNTSYGAASDLNGNYTIALPAGTYSIRAQYIGYKDLTITNVVLEAGKTTSLDFTLAFDVYLSNEVVVIGYGVQKKREVTGSVSSVNMASMEKLPMTSINHALQGMATGVSVSAASGGPGSNPDIYIRGTGTLNDTKPLYIVDGVPTETLFYINPSDIEGIDILKDASAAAIYGSRAANGVINVTTKRGKKGELKLNFNTYQSYQSFNNYMPVVTNSRDYVELARTASENAGIAVPQFVLDYEANPGAYPNTDWQDEYFRSAPSSKYDLSISGGFEKFNFSISGMYAKEDGVIRNTDNEKMSLRINSDINLNSKLTFGESFSIGRNIYKGPLFENSQSYELYRMPPTIPVYDPTNDPSGWGYASTGLGYARVHNPVAEASLKQQKDDDLNVFLSGYLEYKILNNLTFKSQISQQIYDYYRYEWTPSFYISSTWQQQNASLLEQKTREFKTVFENILTYNVSFDEHNINAMAGVAQEKYDRRSMWAYGTTFPSNDIHVLDAATEGQDVGGYEYSSRLRSMFGRLTYDYADKYLIQANIRRDGSSRFAEENRYGVFPSISAGWRISKESFFNIPNVDDLKLRASYGILGNQEIGDYEFIASLNSNYLEINYPLSGGVVSGAIPNQIPAFGIKWEETKSTDFGFDLAMFEDRLSFSADYYIKTTSGILYEVRIPTSTGAENNPWVNAGEMENSGFEFSTAYRNFDSDFKYQIMGNLTTYKNKVTKIGNDDLEAIRSGNIHWSVDRWVTLTTVGQPIASFYLFQSAGLFQSDAEAAGYVNADGEMLQSNAKAGDVKFIDVNGDGVIDDEDRVNMGSAIPDFEYSLNFNATYGNFDFNIFVVGVSGKKLYNGNKVLTSLMSEFGNFHEDYLNAWTPENPNSDVSRVVLNDPNENSRPSDRFLEDASYLRVKHIEVGYTIPTELLHGFGIDKIRVYASAENLLTITGYTGLDPAIDLNPGLTGDSRKFSRGVDMNTYPFAQQFIMGLQLSF